MTVIPFLSRRAKPSEPGTAPPLPADAAATGTFHSPSGGAGAFTGTYRLERFVTQFGQLAAAGVFSGELTNSDGSHIGTGSRRHTAAVEVIATRTRLLARLGPVDVNLLGFIVTVAELTLDVDRTSADIAAGLLIVDALRGTDQRPASISQRWKIANASTARDPHATGASAEAVTPRDGRRRGSTTEG